MSTNRLKNILQRIMHNKYYVRVQLLILFTRFFSDRRYLQLLFAMRNGYRLNLDSPKTFNEKLQWLKLNDRRPDYVRMVDKVEAKKYVSEIIGEDYIIPTLGIYERVEDIDFDKLPNQFVLKCSHDSGGIVICTDKNKLDKKAALKKLRKGLKSNYYYRSREWPYKSVKSRIIAEKYMCDSDNVLKVEQLRDYKIFCFNGEPKFIEVDYDRYVKHKLNVYDLEWNFMDFYMTSPNDKNVKIPKPKQLDKMLEFARKLSSGTTFLRVDLYSIGDDIYFGELTLHPGSGMIDFHPKEFDQKLGNMLKLPIDINC